MGRSGNSKNLAKNLLTGQDLFSLNNSSQDLTKVIKGSLKTDLIKELNGSANRRSLYKNLVFDLRNLNNNLLKKDPTFQKLINFEIEQVAKESGTYIKDYNLSNTTAAFLDDLNKHLIPNLARGLINSEQTPKELTKDLKENYLNSLRSFKNNQDQYFNFAINSYLPLADNKFKKELFRDFSQETTFNLIKDSLVEYALPSVKKMLDRFDASPINQERLIAATELTRHLSENYNQDTNREEILNQIANGQETILTNYIFNILVNPDESLETKSQIANPASQGKIDYLDKLITESKDDRFDLGLVKRIYKIFGGEDQKLIDNFNLISTPITGEKIFKMIQGQGRSGALFRLYYPGETYNFSSNWCRRVLLTS